MRNPRITKRLYRYGELLRNQLVTQKTPVEIFNVLEKSFYEASLEKINEIDLLASIIENEQFLVLFQNESAAIAINRLINHMFEHGVYNSEGFNYILPSALGYALTDKNWQRVSQISFIHNMGLGSNDTWSQRNGSIETIFWSKISNTKDMIFLSQYFRFDLNSSKISHDKQFNAAYIKASRLATELPQGVNNDMPYNSYQALLALVELAKNRDFSNAIDGAIQLFRNPHVLKSSLNLYLVRKLLEHLEDAFKLKSYQISTKILVEEIEAVVKTLADKNVSALVDISLTDRGYTEDLLIRLGCRHYASLIFKHSTNEVTDHDYFLKAKQRYGNISLDDVMSIYHATNNDNRIKRSFQPIGFTPYLMFALESNNKLPFSTDIDNKNNGVIMLSMGYFAEWQLLYNKVKNDKLKSGLMTSLLVDMIKSADSFLEAAKIFSGDECGKSLLRKLQEYINPEILVKIPSYQRLKLESDLSL